MDLPQIRLISFFEYYFSHAYQIVLRFSIQETFAVCPYGVRLCFLGLSFRGHTLLEKLEIGRRKSKLLRIAMRKNRIRVFHSDMVKPEVRDPWKRVYRILINMK